MSALFNRFKKHIGSNFLLYLILSVLLILPFFWFPNNLYIMGGDDTGLEYYNPLGALKQTSSIFYSTDGLANLNESVGSGTVFSFVLYILRIVTFKKINLEILSYGFIIGFSFLYIVRILRLLKEEDKSLGFYIAGLFYSLSSYFFISEYIYFMPSTFLIVVGPAVTFYVLKAIKTKSDKPLLIAAIWSFIFSRALITPMAINFYIFFGLFLLIWTYFTYGVKGIAGTIAKYTKYILFTLLINSIILIPLFFSSFAANSGLKDMVSSRSDEKYLMIDNLKVEFGVNKIKGFLMNTYPEEIVKNLGQMTYPLYKKYINATSFYVYIIVIIAMLEIVKLLKKRDKPTISIIIMFLITLTFVSVDILPFFSNFYVSLMTNIPVFTMNRYPSLKFSVPYVYYYSLLIGLGLNYFFSRNKPIISGLCFILCAVLLVFSNYSSFTGLLLSDSSGLITTSRPMDFNSNYKKLIKDFPTYVKDDSELLLFPLGYGYGTFIAGENRYQMYRSQISGFKNFTNYNLIGNLMSLNTYLDPSIYEAAKKYYFKDSLQNLLELTKKLNIKYIIYTKNPSLLKNNFELISHLTFESKNYLSPVNAYEPIYENEGYIIYKLKNYAEISRFTTERKSTELNFYKIADFMYALKIKTYGLDKLIFHTRFSLDWKFIEIEKKDFKCLAPKNFSNTYPNIYECSHINDNIVGSLQLLEILNKRSLNIINEKYDSYLNSWNIDTNDSYKYYILVVDLQKYFIVGALISMGILVLYVIAIFWRRKSS